MTPTPEEPLNEGSDKDDAGNSASDGDAALRGWIDPDDRLWRHPSELGAGGTAWPPAARPVATRHPRAVILVGAAAAVAAVVWTIVLLSPASDHPAPSLGGESAVDAPLTTLAAHGQAIPFAAQAAGRSMVRLQAHTSHGIVTLVGVAVAEGGLVATTADGLSGLRRLSMVTTDGQTIRASVVAVDAASDVALVSVPDDLPAAPFADDVTLTNGSPDMTLSMAAQDSGTVVQCWPGSVTSIGAAIQSGWAKGMPSITSSNGAGVGQAGEPLLNQAGAVIGLLYGSGSSTTFLPAQLVLGVADDLRSTGRVSHGWLGVEGATASTSEGAQVAALMTGSPATDLLQPGEVIVAVAGVPIRSMADLRARLYVLAPQTTVALSIVDGETARVVDVTLGASP